MRKLFAVAVVTVFASAGVAFAGPGVVEKVEGDKVTVKCEKAEAKSGDKIELKAEGSEAVVKCAVDAVEGDVATLTCEKSELKVGDKVEAAAAPAEAAPAAEEKKEEAAPEAPAAK